MVKKFRRLSSGILAMVMIFSLCFTNAVQAASIDISSENETVGLRTQLTFLEGMPGDNHLVYTYQENGQQYKVVEDADVDFMNVYSTSYVMNSEGNYEEIKSQVLNVQPDGNCLLTSTDTHGNSNVSKIDITKSVKSVDKSTEVVGASIARAYTDPGTGEWVTQTWDGSSYIYNMTVTAIGAVLGAAIGGKVGAAIGAIASEYFKKGSDYAYYHVVDSWMMSALYPMTVIIREATHTTYYLDSGHKYSTGTDYYEYDGRW